MADYASVSNVAWQACGVSLALLDSGPQLVDFDFDDLTALFRWGFLSLQVNSVLITICFDNRLNESNLDLRFAKCLVAYCMWSRCCISS